MRFSRNREREVYQFLSDSPDAHLIFEKEMYRPDGNILIHRDGTAMFLHRYLYLKLIGEIDAPFLLPGCKVEGCQNPWCRTPSISPRPATAPRAPRHRHTGAPTAAQINAAKTHCPYGHEYTPENTYVTIDQKQRKHRKCRTCTLDRTRRQHETARAARPTPPEGNTL